MFEEDERRKCQALAKKQRQQKLSYFQMACMGYQELVNAIIRPPRADYKVRRLMMEHAMCAS